MPFLQDQARQEAGDSRTGQRWNGAVLYVLTSGVLSAMRFVASAPVNRFLSFSLEEDDVHLFAKACEKYLLHHIEHSFSTLSFYKSLLL